MGDEYNENYTNYESTTGLGVEGAEAFIGDNANFETNEFSSQSFEQQSSTASTSYQADNQGLYQDPNPQIVRRPATTGTQVYTQRVIVKFLQPPPVPPPGVNDLNNNVIFHLYESLYSL